MGVLLKWKKITSEATYDTVRVYRASGQTATYELIHSQGIYDNSYYDPSGNGSFWYKVEFYDSVAGDVSALSDASQGGTFYGYCSVEEVRMLTNIRSADINDTQLATLIEFSGTQLNNDINVLEEDERVLYMDEEKENDIDGTNLVYYTRQYPIADRNNDFRVTTADMEAYTINSDGFRTSYTITQVNAATGQFRVALAPGSDEKLFVTYSHTKRRVDNPNHDKLIKMACIMLTASYGYGKLNIGKADRFRMGSLTVFRDKKAPDIYYKRYITLLAQINDRSIANTIDGTLMPADQIAYLAHINISGILGSN